MNPHTSFTEPVPDRLAPLLARLDADQRIRRTLPDLGHIHLDRRLPFLAVYRRPDHQGDPGAEQLVTSEAAYFSASGAAGHHRRVAEAVRLLAERAAAHFGSFLILEVWPEPIGRQRIDLYEDGGEPLPPTPGFRILARPPQLPETTIDALANALRRIRVFHQPAEVVVDVGGKPCPPGTMPLLTGAQTRRLGCYLVGLQVRPIYRDPFTGDLYPAVLRRMRRGIGRALKRAFYAFACGHTKIRPQHYYALGRRAVVKAVWEVDAQLVEVGSTFDLLLQSTPINVETAWNDFRRSRFTRSPQFHYRPLAVDPPLLKRRLYEIAVERIEDPTLAHLCRQKQDELDRKLTMLADIGTPRFLPGSLQVWGAVRPPLLALAEDLLKRISPRTREPARGSLDAAAFAARAAAECEHYRRLHPAFTATVTIREDMYTGLLTSRGHLLVGQKTRIPQGRVEALVQHEVGTHLVTYYNAAAQPLKQLRLGLAGYDGLQEGLAVLAEYLVGGMSRSRLRLLAARVVAVQRMLEGASFADLFHLLDRTYGFPQRVAYTIAMRVFRGGGLTKDLVYLQGLVEILDYLKSGGELEPLLIGKIAAEHIPLVGELQMRQVLRPPPLRPRYMDHPLFAPRLERLRRGLTVLQLCESGKP